MTQTIRRGKHNHAINLNLVLEILRQTTPYGGVTLEELKARCGVSSRQVYRYLNELEVELEIDLERPRQYPGINGKYRLYSRYLPDMEPETALIKYQGQAWGVWHEGPVETVILKFRAEIADRIKKICYHPSQTNRELEDGSLMVGFCVVGIKEMVPWILGWGDQVEILEPEALRKQVLNKVERMLKIYRSGR